MSASSSLLLHHSLHLVHVKEGTGPVPERKCGINVQMQCQAVVSAVAYCIGTVEASKLCITSGAVREMSDVQGQQKHRNVVDTL